jgi:hypothetical protein
MLQALRGLVKNDQAYRKIVAAKVAAKGIDDAAQRQAELKRQLQGVRDLLAGKQGAIADLFHAQQAADRGDPVQLYLLQAQLAAYRNYMQFVQAETEAPVPAGDPERKRADAALQSLSNLLGETRPEQKGALVGYWVKLCGLAPPQP